VNLAFHLGAALTVWLLALEVLARLSSLAEGSRQRAAFCTALLFAVHPVQTEAVTYVVQRATSMGAFFGLLALWLYLRARLSETRRRLVLFAGAALAGALAVSSKENLVVLPLLVAILEVLLFPGWRERFRRHRVALGAAAAGTVGLAALVGAAYWSVIVAEQERFGLSIAERLLTQPRILFYYLSLLAWPLTSRLDVDIDFAPSHALLDPPTTLVSLVGLAALLAAAVAQRRRLPLVTFAIAWFLGALAIEQSVFPIDLASEHRIYFASFGPLLLLSFAVERLASRVALPAWLAVVPAIAALATGTWLRNDEWNDPVRINVEVASRARPGTFALSRSLLSLGSEYLERGELDRAEAALRRLVSVEPTNSNAWLDLGTVAFERGDLATAERLYRRAITANGWSKDAWYDLASLLMEEKRFPEAERALRMALAVDPSFVSARVNLGVLYFWMKDMERTRVEFAAALRVDPSAADAYGIRARTFLGERRLAEALEDAHRVRRARRRERRRARAPRALPRRGRPGGRGAAGVRRGAAARGGERRSA